ncbi:MAG: hypothetical protein GY714_32345 [Desulfobacterales bacterium]|nr:hypothetical protein [Desulfobacterales bacterium]
MEDDVYGLIIVGLILFCIFFLVYINKKEKDKPEYKYKLKDAYPRKNNYIKIHEKTIDQNEINLKLNTK